MNNENKSDLKDLLADIENNRILLPDFQRRFVWKTEDVQTKLVASVLARMPIGSILLLESNVDEYASKLIGRKITPDLSQVEGEVRFLLDGQQRMTVLANVFSNVIHKNCDKVSDLNSPSLKKRFFLFIPKWGKLEEEEHDWFGVRSFKFPYRDLKKEPDFLSSDMEKHIKCYSFKSGGEEAFNPQKKLSTELDNFCVTSNEKGYLIPLFLLCSTSDAETLKYGKILEKIADAIEEEIEDHFSVLEKEEKIEFCKTMFGNEFETTEILEMKERLSQYNKPLWLTGIRDYLEKCVTDLQLNRIVVSADQRVRAIDIYENLNRGGISLNTFDLIMARVATVTNQSFDTKIEEDIRALQEYDNYTIPDVVAKYFVKLNKYNATINTKCLNNEISSKYIDVFLDVLCLYINNKSFAEEGFNPESIKVDYIKKEAILKMNPNEIVEYEPTVVKAIDRAMFFLQARCGIRNIAEINYSLIVVLIAFIFISDDFYKDKKNHDLLEAWYWASVFSGEFDKDQNSKLILNIKRIIRTLQGTMNTGWIISMKDAVFAMPDFSDEELLLMDKASEDKLPKEVLRHLVCQFYLSQTYIDLFDSGFVVNVFCDEVDELEEHHIVPLGSALTVEKSTAELRRNGNSICNSPMNFALITKTANKRVLSDSLESYYKRITEESKTQLNIPYTDTTVKEEDIRKALHARFNATMGAVKSRITALLG